MDAKAKSRVRLWLQSEKIFGLPSVAAPAILLDRIAETPTFEPVPQRLKTPENQETNVRKVLASAAPMKTAPKVAPVVEFDPGPALIPLGAPASNAKPFEAPVLKSDEKLARLTALNNNEVRGCTKCRLCETRTQTVFGEGDHDAKIFIIGEGPGQNEDEMGKPFVGRSGELLNKWIAAMGLAREQVFIANIVKCRPPGNREPAPDEVATCTPYLERQLEIVRPKVIITVGRPSAQYMLGSKLAMSRLRGQWHAWRGIKLMPTYHPAYVLRSYTVETRGAVWNDLKMVMAELGLKEPRKGAAEK
jgi:DNA polymerase